MNIEPRSDWTFWKHALHFLAVVLVYALLTLGLVGVYMNAGIEP